MFNDLFLENLIAELELIDAINKVFLWEKVYAGVCAGTHHSHFSDLRVVDDFLEAECFIASNQIKSYDLLQPVESWTLDLLVPSASIMDCLAPGSKLLNPLLRSCFHCSLCIWGIFSRLAFISFLCHFKLTTSDEIDTIYSRWAFTVDFLTSDELFGPHILINFFNDVRPQRRKDTESSQEFDNLL